MARGVFSLYTVKKGNELKKARRESKRLYYVVGYIIQRLTDPTERAFNGPSVPLSFILVGRRLWQLWH